MSVCHAVYQCCFGCGSFLVNFHPVQPFSLTHPPLFIYCIFRIEKLRSSVTLYPNIIGDYLLLHTLLSWIWHCFASKRFQCDTKKNQTEHSNYRPVTNWKGICLAGVKEISVYGLSAEKMFLINTAQVFSEQENNFLMCLNKDRSHLKIQMQVSPKRQK